MTSIEKLMSISSAPIAKGEAAVNRDEISGFGPLGEQLQSLLKQRNGFYAFEAALHVFPASPQEKELTLGEWNTFDLWRFEYGELAHKAMFFAEDAFGNQFCIRDNRVCSFDAETGALDVLASSLEEWAKRLLSEYRVLTGHPLIHLWQERNGSIPTGARLMPKIPFVLGGEYSLGNLYALSDVRAMRSRGNLARQLKNLPDGSQIEFRVVD